MFLSATSTRSRTLMHLFRSMHLRLLVDEIYLSMRTSIRLDVNHLLLVDAMINILNFSMAKYGFKFASNITLMLQTHLRIK